MTDTTGHEPTPQPEPLTPESVACFTDLLRNDLGVQHEDHLALVRRQQAAGEYATKAAIAERQRSWERVMHSWRLVTVVAVVTGMAVGAGLLLRNRDNADPITATPPTSPDSSDSSGEPAETGDGIRYFGGEVPLTVHMTGHQAALITTTDGVETVEEYADADETIDVSAWVAGHLEQAESTHEWSMYLDVSYQTPLGATPSWYVTFEVRGDVVLPG